MENLIDKMPIIIVLLNWHRNMSCHFYEYKSKSVQPKPPEESESSHFFWHKSSVYKGLRAFLINKKML